MEYTNLGNTDIRESVAGLGCGGGSRLGQARGLSTQESVALVRVAMDLGVNYLDTAAVYFNQAPVFRINKSLGGFRTPDWIKDEIWQKEVPRAVVNFAEKNVLLSGMMNGEQEVAGAPVIVDVPVGKGHVILFANRPFWRWETRGSHAFVFNAILHWNDLRVGWPERPEQEEPRSRPAAGHEYHQQHFSHF